MLEKKNNGYFEGIKQIISVGMCGDDKYINKIPKDYINKFKGFNKEGIKFYDINKELIKEIKDLEEKYILKGIKLSFNYRRYLDKEGIVYDFLILDENQKGKGIFKETTKELKKIGNKYNLQVYACACDKWTEKELLLEIYKKSGWIPITDDEDFGIPYMTHKVK